MTAPPESPLARQWVEKAENDLRNATIVVREKDPPTDTICFHCHQTAEKYLKAYLVSKNLPLHKVHDLRYLLNQCLRIDPELAELEEAIEALNGYYIETRYPLDDPILYSIEEALEAVDLAHRVRNVVAGKLL